MIPLVGEAADGVNAAIYAARGDYMNAALSAAAMIPIASWAATGAKLAIKGADAANSIISGIKLSKKLASEAQMAEKGFTIIRAVK